MRYYNKTSLTLRPISRTRGYHRIGCFNDPEEAARWYDVCAFATRSEQRLNNIIFFKYFGADRILLLKSEKHISLSTYL